jgi:prevent-host-death family protein
VYYVVFDDHSETSSKRGRASTTERQIPVRELNQRTSAVLDQVIRGHALTITRDGHPIARLIPIVGTASVLDRWVAEGLATAPTVVGPFPLPPPSDDATTPDAAALLVKDRDEERG